MNKNIPLVNLKAQHKKLWPEINEKLKSIFEDCAFIGGQEKDLFEKEFARLLGAKECIGVGNGTDSLSIILKSLGIGLGDEVITVANSFFASSEAIGTTGAKTIFIDCCPNTMLIDLDKLSSYLASRAKNNTIKTIKAIMVVHLYGRIVNMPRLMEIANRYNLKVIEDCAQSHLAEIDGIKAGVWGVAGSFSFYPGKNLGAAGDAGAIITNDLALAKKMRMMANHGRIDKYNHEFEGFNSRLDNIQAAVLRIKLKYISEWTKARIRNARFYDSLLSEFSTIIRPEIPSDGEHVFHHYIIRLQNREKIMDGLKKRGVESGIHYPIMLPALKAYAGVYNLSDYPVAQKLQGEILSLPVCPELTSEDQRYIVNSLIELISSEGTRVSL